MKFNIKKSVLVLVVFMMGLNYAAFAAEPVTEDVKAYLENLKSAVPEVELEECHRLVELYDLETLTFFKFLEENFQNKSSTTSLSNIAISRYVQYKKALRDIFAQLAPEAKTAEDIKKFETAYESYSVCFEITDTYIDLAKERMITHIKNNASQKKTTILLEKYQAINDRLRELNMVVAEMYGFFATFKNKLPGFLSNCVTSP